MLLYAGAGVADVAALEAAAGAAAQAAHGRAEVYVVADPDADVADTVVPLITDIDGEFARAYVAKDVSAYVVRPDGYLGLAARAVAANELADTLVRHLRATFV